MMKGSADGAFVYKFGMEWKGVPSYHIHPPRVPLLVQKFKRDILWTDVDAVGPEFFDRPWWSVPSWSLVDPRMLALLANRAARWFWSSWKGNSRIAPPPVSSQVPEEVGEPDHPQVPLIPTCTSCTSYYRASDPTGKGIWHPEDPNNHHQPFHQ